MKKSPKQEVIEIMKCGFCGATLSEDRNEPSVSRIVIFSKEKTIAAPLCDLHHEVARVILVACGMMNVATPAISKPGCY